MKLIWFALLITYCTALDTQENEDSARSFLRRDLEDLMRRMTQEQPLRTTHTFRSSFLDPVANPEQEESLEETSRLSTLRFGGGEPQKHPFDEYPPVDVDAVAVASARDVDEEENLARNLVDLLKYRMDSDSARSSVGLDTTDDLSTDDKTGPYTSMHRQIETVIRKEDQSFSDVYFVAIVAGCCAVGIFGVISAGVCFYRLQKSRKAAADVDYPAYGVTGPCKDLTSPNGDRKLAQSAQMYHYQHQKQQMIAVEKAGSTKNTSASDVDSEEENEEGDYTVYECPGLAPAGEMEVKNPLFHDDSTPVSPPVPPPSKSDSGN